MIAAIAEIVSRQAMEWAKNELSRSTFDNVEASAYVSRASCPSAVHMQVSTGSSQWHNVVSTDTWVDICCSCEPPEAFRSFQMFCNYSHRLFFGPK